MDGGKASSHIRSYVLRQGRLTSGQANALDQYWPRYGIDFSGDNLDLDEIFGRSAPRVLDIGVGTGDTTIEIASRHPENDYLAVEVHRPGVGNLLRRIEEEGLKNIRVICHDVFEVLGKQQGKRLFDQVFIFFPDPWPKKKHHKRRLIRTEFLDLLLPLMKLNGCLYIATDWSDLANHVIEICDPHPGLVNLAGAGKTAPRPNWRPLTRFEQRGERLEHQVYDFMYGLSIG